MRRAAQHGRTYYFRAFYSGDTNNTGPVSSTCADETLVVSPNTPTISTLFSQSTGNVGDSVHDSATFNGATADAGGTIRYAVYSDNPCNFLVADLTPADKTVANGVVPDSDRRLQHGGHLLLPCLLLG